MAPSFGPPKRAIPPLGQVKPIVAGIALFLGSILALLMGPAQSSQIQPALSRFPWQGLFFGTCSGPILGPQIGPKFCEELGPEREQATIGLCLRGGLEVSLFAGLA